MPIPGTVQVTGPVAPTDTTDTFPTHSSQYGQGGHHEAADIVARDAIPTARRTQGMMCYVVSDGVTYVLEGGISNIYWTPFTTGSVTREMVFFDEISLSSLTTGHSPGAFQDKTPKHYNVVSKGNITAAWTDLFQYVNWMFTSHPSNTRLGPVKFATYGDFVTYLKNNLPTTGVDFDDGVVTIEAYDDIDVDDPFPMTRRCRNSMVASMKGRGRWIPADPGEQYDVTSGFENYYGAPIGDNLAAQLVNHFTGVMPGTNDNRAIWYTRARKTRWSFPKHGALLQLPSTSRGAVWDIVGGAWVNPAPAGNYDYVSTNPSPPPIRESPILLFEDGGNGTLIFENQTDRDNQVFQMTGVCALVFPVIDSARYLSFVVYPYGVDTIYTEYVDPASYILQARINYRGRKSPRYARVPAHQHDGQRMSMFKFWGGGGNYLFPQDGSYLAGYASNPDNHMIPISVDICRRNINTGTRTPWAPCLKMSRRIPHANLHIKPHHSWS